jgi:D-lactate dehydrogenase
LKNLELAGDTNSHQLLLEQFQYDGNETCAVDGMCATACPVDINTGDLIKRLRRENHSAASNKQALWIAKHFAFVEKLARTGLHSGVSASRLLGNNAIKKTTSLIRRVIPAFSYWSDQLTSPPRLTALKQSLPVHGSGSAIVYFPACITRMMGSYAGHKKNAIEAFLSVCNKAKIDVHVLQGIAGACCSQVFSSKGFGDAHRYTANKIVDQMWQSSRQGNLPIVIDVSSCAYTLHHIRPALEMEMQQKFDALTIMDSVEFLHDMVMPFIKVEPLPRSIVLHPVCSLVKMKTDQKFFHVAKQLATNVTIPAHTNCCGMAGDRGFLFPELTASATAAEAKEVSAKTYDGYYSTTKTCEIAMSEAVKKNYESILYLADEALGG